MIQLYGLLAAPGNLTGMRDQTIEAFLGELAARVPAPGGGATAALHAAQAAALLAMVARYSDGPRYDAELMDSLVTRADKLWEEALTLAEADAAAFGAVAEAYRLPKDTAQEKDARSAAIAAATAEAAIRSAGGPAAPAMDSAIAADRACCSSGVCLGSW
jgi:formiminotetrahydrofolate cyclodeaminase